MDRRAFSSNINGAAQPELLMSKLNKIILLGAALLVLAGGKSLAQPGGPGGAGGFGGQGGAPMDPQQIQAQMQARAQQFFRDQLAVTNDEEWSVIEPRLTAVTQLKTESVMSGMGALRSLMGGGGRGANAQAGGGRRAAGGGGGLAALAPPSPEATALQAAIDDQAPKEELKAALAKLRESRKRKLAQLEAAEEQLRQVLTVRQEAILVSLGLLD